MNHSWSPPRWSTGLYVNLKQTLADIDQRFGNVALYEGRNVAVWYQEASIAQMVECWHHKLVVWGVQILVWAVHFFIPQDRHIYVLLRALGHLYMLWGKVFNHVHWLLHLMKRKQDIEIPFWIVIIILTVVVVKYFNTDHNHKSRWALAHLCS